MRRIALAAGGLLALGLLAAAPAASAGTLGGAGAAVSRGLDAQAAPQDVRWARQCKRVRVWVNGRWTWRTRCRDIWVGARCGPQWGRRC